jgi:hypothetical protein
MARLSEGIGLRSQSDYELRSRPEIRISSGIDPRHAAPTRKRLQLTPQLEQARISTDLSTKRCIAFHDGRRHSTQSKLIGRSPSGQSKFGGGRKTWSASLSVLIWATNGIESVGQRAGIF